MPFDWLAFGEGAWSGAKEGFLTAMDIRKMQNELKLQEFERVAQLMQAKASNDQVALQKLIKEYEIYENERARVDPIPVSSLRGQEWFLHQRGDVIARTGEDIAKPVKTYHFGLGGRLKTAEAKLDLVTAIRKVDLDIDKILSAKNESIKQWQPKVYDPVLAACNEMRRANSIVKLEKAKEKALQAVEKTKSGVGAEKIVAFVGWGETIVESVYNQLVGRLDLSNQLQILQSVEGTYNEAEEFIKDKNITIE